MDTEYVIDSAFELAEITALEYAVLNNRLGAYWTVRELVDNNIATPQHFLQNTARSRLNNASLPEQYFFALCGLAGLDQSLKFFAERAEHLVQCKLQQDLGRAQPPRQEFNPEFAQGLDLVSISDESEIGEGTVRQLLNQLMGPAATRWSADLRLMGDAVAWYCTDTGKTFHQILESGVVTNPGAHNASDMVRNALKAQRAALQQDRQRKASLTVKARAAIKKATKLFQSLGEDKNLKLFVSGSEVSLAHPQSPFKFILKPLQVSGWLEARTVATHTYTPYELSLYTKEDVYLSKLCVYFDSTPVLDQLLALTLFVQSGDELKILEKANWFAFGTWTEEKSKVVLGAYPQLQKKLPLLTSDGKQRATKSCIEELGLRNLEVFRQHAHWEPFKGRVNQWVKTWMEPAVTTATQLGDSMADLKQTVIAAERVQRKVECDVRKQVQQQVQPPTLVLATT